LASRVLALQEILTEEEAFLVVPDDAEALVVGIRETLQHKENAERMAERAKEKIQQYSWSARAALILGTLK
jgi:glycosyltransferase involved in cell wall biosynthesis